MNWMEVENRFRARNAPRARPETPEELERRARSRAATIITLAMFGGVATAGVMFVLHPIWTATALIAGGVVFAFLAIRAAVEEALK